MSPEELKKVIKTNRVSSNMLTDIYWYTNSSIRNDTFSEEFELAEVTSHYKRADSFDKINHRPIHLLFQKSMENYSQSNQYILWTGLL